MSEKKGPLLPAGAAPQPRQSSAKIWLRAVACVLITYNVLYWSYVAFGTLPSLTTCTRGQHRPNLTSGGERCPQVEPITPGTSDALQRMDEHIASSEFANETVKRMAGAIQIPSVSYDDLGPVGEDPRWETMYDVAAYLEKTFPRVHEHLKLEKINTHGLLYTWEGSDPALKPTVLMAHQDVVPVEESTIDKWTHPPFSGAFDGKLIWGRGASDCKNTLIGSLEAVELLLEAGYEPKRTLVLSYGFDEEISGRQGAAHLSSAILERYGPNGVASIVDEGAGVSDMWGTTFAMPGVAEKGYMDVEVVVRTPGGHSSIPPPHTGIGILSEIVAAVEAHPYTPNFAPENPFLELLQCGADYAEEFPQKLKKLLPKPGAHGHHKHHHKKGKKDKLAHEAAKMGPEIKYLFTSSAAVDVISGGVKLNALPERANAFVNHRINVGESSADIKKKLTKLADKVAQKHNLTLHAFDGEEEEMNSITLRAGGPILEPAPVTPTEVDRTTAYSVLAGTTRGLYGKDLVVSPGLMTGNTDTRYYWDVSGNIFRFTPGYDPEFDPFRTIHTVDEGISLVAHVRTVQWYSAFIRNMDEADLE